MTAQAPPLPGNGTCRCGNAGATICGRCSIPVCSLCVRQDELGTGICLACRSGMIKLEEFRQARPPARPVTLARSVLRIRKNLIFVPAFLVASLSIATAIVFPLASELGAAQAERAERHARDALVAIARAESVHRKTSTTYAPFEVLVGEKAVKPFSMDGYELRVVLMKDGLAYEAHAVATESGLRSMFIDARGDVRYEAEPR